MYALDPLRQAVKNDRLRKVLLVMVWVLGLQLLLGGIMSGMKAGIYYPTWPDMNGQLIPGLLFDAHYWSWTSFVEYDKYVLAPALVQFVHRLVAYVLFGLMIYFVAVVRRIGPPAWYTKGSMTVGGVLLLQVILGILTVINCQGKIPLVLGVMHQAGAIMTLMILLYMMRKTIRE
jgi:cytochrome c oxidase assembly protein subunit 15